MHYAGKAQLKDLGLNIPEHVEEAVRRWAAVCASCDDPQAPIGLDSHFEYLEWAQRRALLGRVEPLTSEQRARAFPNSRHTACAACNDRLIAVIGIPTALLVDLLRGLDDVWFGHFKNFLETRFVILLCKNCASSDAELGVTMDKLNARYRKVREMLAKESWDVTPADATRFADRLFTKLAACVASRDSQIAR